MTSLPPLMFTPPSTKRVLGRKCDPQLSSVYFEFSIVYLSFLVHWILVCFKVKPTFRRIHLLMAGLILVKALNLIYAAVNVTDTHESGNNLLFLVDHHE
ncbi:unnamed protein product [Lactuca virosa]|uniref:THH1/TOM1/TOM3 domain-containing protein n=1 Tax=Lactuca virosa TaxID=75947 RepID=A0AAU9M6P8_9ASTR|nr:unnamed protein product [Lactuca virosa]